MLARVVSYAVEPILHAIPIQRRRNWGSVRWLGHAGYFKGAGARRCRADSGSTTHPRSAKYIWARRGGEGGHSRHHLRASSQMSTRKSRSRADSCPRALATQIIPQIPTSSERKFSGRHLNRILHYISHSGLVFFRSSLQVSDSLEYTTRPTCRSLITSPET